MVRPEMKVAEVLRRWPELLQVFLEASPAFHKLKNPLLRRTMPNLVTVAQAARIAGLTPEELVERLNRALGLGAFPSGKHREAAQGPKEELPSESLLHTPPPPWLSAPARKSLDVRPILEAGGEPFQAIMAAAQEVKEGEQLVLEVLFEPIPLYKVLAKRGFAAWCEKLGERHYRAHFYRQGVERGLPSQGAFPSGEHRVELDWGAYHAEVFIEENLEPPLPMMRVLEALAQLRPGERLLVHHVRRPVHLLARLEEVGPGRVEILIERRR